MTAQFAALRAFISRHWFWVLLLLTLNVTIWIGLERRVFRTMRPAEVWPIRMYLLSGLLLFDNLCVLWWYADSTRRQMEATEQEVYENRLARWRDNKPIVFLELAEFVGAEDDHGNVFTIPKYLIRNTGNGPALNVFLLKDIELPSAAGIPLGALGAHQERRIDYLSGGEFRCVIVAEGLSSRTRRWNATLNLGLRGSSEVVHGLVDLGPDRTMGDDERHSLDEFLAEHRPPIARQLRALTAPTQGIAERIEL